MKNLLIFCFVTLFVTSVTFAEETKILDGHSAANTNKTEKAEEKTEKIHYPSYKEVGRAIKSLGSNLEISALKDCLKTLNIDNQKNVNKLFERFLKKSKKVIKKRGNDSTDVSRFKTELKKGRKRYGNLAKKESENFSVIYPKNLKFKNNKKEVIDFDVDAILTAADTSFSKMTEMLMMSKFIYWPGKSRGNIYIVPNMEIWKLIKKGVSKKQLVQTIVMNPDSREIFVLIDKNSYQEAEQAVAYAVAKATLNEYSEVVSDSSRSVFPAFYVVGIAATAAELDSVLTDEDGPQQLKKFSKKEVTRKMLEYFKEKKPEFYPLPLSEKKLFNIEDIVKKIYPNNKNERIYYYMRQSKAVVSYLQQNGTLPFLIFSKELADGKGLKRSFDEYIELRDELSGRTKKGGKRLKEKKSKREKRKDKEKEEAAKSCLDGYKEFMDKDNAKTAIFIPLTLEYLKKDSIEKKQDKKRAKSKKGKRR